MRRPPIRLASLALLGALAGCGFQPRPFPTPDTELGNRPGLLTGPTGAATVTCCPRPSPNGEPPVAPARGPGP